MASDFVAVSADQIRAHSPKPTTAGLFDTHCHLYMDDAFPDIPETIARANSNGVTDIVIIGTDTRTSARAIEIAERHDGVHAVVGWHPNSASEYRSSDLSKIAELAKHERVVAIGEIGLDSHWDFASPESQRACTSDHLQLAIETGLPVVFHCRDAYDELLDWLEALQTLPRRMVMHCFGGGADHAARARALDCYFGFDGPVTYKKNDSLRALALATPPDRILVETDAPYLAPEPFRGKRNEPAMIQIIAARMAESLGIPFERFAALTSENARRFFGLRSSPD